LLPLLDMFFTESCKSNGIVKNDIVIKYCFEVLWL